MDKVIETLNNARSFLPHRSTDPIVRSMHEQIDQALEALAAYKPDGWQDMATAPRDEMTPFLVLWENPDNALITLQVGIFEGHLYPHHMGGNVDLDDAIDIDHCHGWMPAPPTKTTEDK